MPEREIAAECIFDSFRQYVLTSMEYPSLPVEEDQNPSFLRLDVYEIISSTA